ncbi:MAG: hypothetical protein MN733_14765 [Nitrososphaera sp.]|nr:hypothetical protein [Nitrososphaera sp.]
MGRRKRKVVIQLPDEFIELCDQDMTTPEVVLRGFIADLCGIVNVGSNPRADGYGSNGSDERTYAQAYYDRVGYAYSAKWTRENDQLCTTEQRLRESTKYLPNA